MKTPSSRAGLIALNIMLLAVLGAVSIVPPTETETQTQTPPSRTYIAVPGEVNGLTSGAVYVVDTTTNDGELVAITWNHNNNRIEILGYRSLATDISAAMRK